MQLPLEDDAQLSQQQLDKLAGTATEPEPAAAGASGSKAGLTFPLTSSGKDTCCHRQAGLETFLSLEPDPSHQG